jgi:hypothetical protein
MAESDSDGMLALSDLLQEGIAHFPGACLGREAPFSAVGRDIGRFDRRRQA